MTGCLLNESFGFPADDVPTSSHVEVNFRVVKLDLFARKRRINVDRWLEIHSNHLLGESKAAHTAEDEHLSDEEIDRPDLIIKLLSDNESVDDVADIESSNEFDWKEEPKSKM